MSGKIDINEADAATLAELPGIGQELAQRIVQFREEEHPFEDVFDLVEVPGISVRMVRAFEAQVTVGEEESDGPEAATAVAQAELSEETPETETPEPETEETEALPAEIPDEAAETEVEEPAELLEETLESQPVSPAESEVEAETAATKPDETELDTVRLVQPESEETVMEEESQPTPPPVTAVPPPDAREWETRAQRRGCFSAIAGAAFGAILGAALTLAILAGINQGKLTYNEADSQILQQLQTETEARSDAINAVATQMSLDAATEAAVDQNLEEEIGAVATHVGENRQDVLQIESTIEAVDTRVSEIAGAAETFNTFLLGLREVILELEPDLPITPTATATKAATKSATTAPTRTPAGQTPSPEATGQDTVTPTSTATTRPTRTPRPTATPLPFPTSTPASQP